MRSQARVRSAVIACAALAVTLSPTHARAQQRQCGFAGARSPNVVLPNAKYDGRFTFARIAYTETSTGRRGYGRNREPYWHHDYPDADQHFPLLLSNLSSIKSQTATSVIVSLADPLLFKFPVAYLVEAGHWSASEQEVLGLRKYLQKGGFIIFDDLSDQTGDMSNFMYQMRRVLPGMRLVELTPDHPIFDSFYRVKALDYYHPYYCMKSQFYGIFADNDPAKRMMGIVNYNNDVGEYWEWSDRGFLAVDPSNEAYKLGINYLIYALTR